MEPALKSQEKSILHGWIWFKWRLSEIKLLKVNDCIFFMIISLYYLHLDNLVLLVVILYPCALGNCNNALASKNTLMSSYSTDWVIEHQPY